MAINKKLIHFKNKLTFELEVANGNILDTSIVFIQDSKEIYTHGTIYDGKSVDLSDIESSVLKILEELGLDELNAILVDTGDVASDPEINDYVSPTELLDTLTNYATKSEIPTTTSQLTNNSGFITDVSNKLDVIDDLATIRSGASAGATAILPVAISDMETKTNASATYATKTELNTHAAEAKEYTDNTIKNLVNAAPDTLDTLGELATAITNNQNVVDLLEDSVANKVDKNGNKGLSTNDYTTEEKNKLAGIAAGAQVNTVTGIKGSAETSYRTGNINITPANLGITVVNNTADSNKSVKYATSAGSATNLSAAPSLAASGNNITVTAGSKTSSAFTVPYAVKATQDASGNTITSTYAKKAESVIANGTVTAVVAMTQALYDALSTKSATTLYIITD